MAIVRIVESSAQAEPQQSLSRILAEFQQSLSRIPAHARPDQTQTEDANAFADTDTYAKTKNIGNQFAISRMRERESAHFELAPVT